MTTEEEYLYDERYIPGAPITGEFYKLNISQILIDFDMSLMELDFPEIDETGKILRSIYCNDICIPDLTSEYNNLLFCLGRCEFINYSGLVFSKENGARFMFGRHYIYIQNRIINKYMEHINYETLSII